MKFTSQIEIDAQLAVVLDYYQNPENLKNWQDGYLSTELLDGEVGQKGAKSKLQFQQGKRKMELIETILVNDLPNQKKALYEHIHMSNTMSSKFQEISTNKTLFTAEVEYTKFNGMVPKLMAKLFPSLFKKQVDKWLAQFKKQVEIG